MTPPVPLLLANPADPAEAVQIDRLDCHRDPRGLVCEPLPGSALKDFHNVHLVVSQPGAVRGNHYHVRGTEVSAVQGPMLVRFRLGTVLRDVEVPAGEVWRFRFPAGVPHAFLNMGSAPAWIVSFNTEAHDRVAPDVVRVILIEPQSGS